MSLIACENVSIGYGSKIIAENLNFTVETGDFLCIIGENGVGKSTLIKTLLNLQKPLRGTIKFNISAGEIGFLAQETQISSDFPASVAEIVISGRLTPKKFFYNADDEKIAAHNMNLLKILPLKQKSFRELSGGQQKRVLLARALCSASKILILDEPTANLDPNSDVCSSDLNYDFARLKRVNFARNAHFAARKRIFLRKTRGFCQCLRL